MVVWREAEARPHYVDDSTALCEEGVNDGGAIRDQRCLQHVREKRKHGMKGFPCVIAFLLDRNALAELAVAVIEFSVAVTTPAVGLLPAGPQRDRFEHVQRTTPSDTARSFT